jgi:ABC transporter DrrB family efflux protein
VLPVTPWDRLRWAVADSWVITSRDLTHRIQQPAEIVVRLMFPLISVLLFGYVFGSAIQVPGGGDYREFLLPGMFAISMVMGATETIGAITTDAGRGVTDRFRALPMARSGVVVGRSLADMVNSVADLIILVGCGLLVGWRWHNGVLAALAAVGLLLLLRFAFIWVGVYLGLVARSPEMATTLSMLVFPFGMLTNAFVAPELMPGWIGTVAEWNPLSPTIAAARELFGNPGVGGDSWIAENSLLMAVVIPVVLVLVFLPLSVRRYLRLSR